MPGPSHAAEVLTTGKIAGRVIDAATGESLPGAQIFIEETQQGTVSDMDGNYIILNIRPGAYTVRAQMVGFARKTVEDVRVNIGETTRIDFEMREEVFEGEEIVVTAEREIVQVDRTTTTAFVDSEQLEALPVQTVQGAINLQAGVVAGRFRGGRTGEVATFINGVPINNVFNNSQSFEVEQNMVSQIEVISGVFAAEYGQAMS
ncbi:MAG: TonB-dependent receptor, partial [Bacteroidota bacterium]